MFKKITFLTFLAVGLCWPSTASAQTSVNSSNAYLEQATGSISYTLGQIQQATYVKEGTMLTQGFQQPFLLISSITSLPKLGLEIKAYPNPTMAQLQLVFTKGFQPEAYRVQLYDLFGRLHFQTNLEAAQSEINLSNKASGTYLLRLLSNDQVIQTIKILKTQ